MDRRAAATTIVRRLRNAGHETYLAGGCVRDQLLGREPSDFDVATAAPPETVQALFPRTVPVCAQFGVILVIEEGLRVEVATFRADDAYVDGRHPVAVRFTTPDVRQVAPNSARGAYRPVLVRGVDRFRHFPPVEVPWRA